ncbi:hypothetical protein BOTBODRAFT_234812 [Botryobasidium botryosum FD-172 SS1]|uniref:Major facilitator superfamily (MFS) profile domain-containing protein n=1 Tax=Botryobasidium botryosum (strain FD-172 SS1) TaxID=930990 RepID=A0A067LUK8_BOTB1|nr:hypothetical protein BOTBODRAFT_234812 [Botryobasidium botryosum FD-172 SS1]
MKSIELERLGATSFGSFSDNQTGLMTAFAGSNEGRNLLRRETSEDDLGINSEYKLGLISGLPEYDPLPKLQLATILVIQAAEPFSSTVIYPFINQLISDIGITGGDEKRIGYYAGLVESLFYLTECMCILQWGRLSDKLGRRPIVLTGLFGLALSQICFGLSRNFSSIVISRALAGALNGNVGVLKCMIAEITSERNRPKAFGILLIVWAVGSTMGSLVGGTLARPAERWPGVFEGSFWVGYPYFLPCAVAAGFSAGCFVLAYLVLEESLQTKIKKIDNAEYDLLPLQSPSTPTSTRPSHTHVKLPAPSIRAILTPRVISAVLNYALLGLLDIAFLVLQPLFLASPPLSLPPPTIGTILGVVALANGLFQAMFFAPLRLRLGTRNIFVAGMASFIGIFGTFPWIHWIVERGEGEVTAGAWAVISLQAILYTTSCLAYGCAFLFVTSSAPSKHTMGATNGLSQMTISFMRAVGPAAATSLFALGLERGIMGGKLVYLVFGGVAVAAVGATALLPKEAKSLELGEDIGEEDDEP